MTTTERIADRRTAALYIAVVMSCGFITFYSLPDALLFLGRLTMMVSTQIVVGLAPRNAVPEQEHEKRNENY